MSIIFNKNNTLACIGTLSSICGLGWLFSTQALTAQLGIPLLTHLETFALRAFNVSWHGLSAYFCFNARKSKSEEFKEHVLTGLIFFGTILTLYYQYGYSNGLFRSKVPFIILQSLNAGAIAWMTGALFNDDRLIK